MRLVRAITLGTIAVASLLVISAGAPAQAEWHGGGHRGWHGGWHRGWHRPGVVVAPVFPPPVYYAPPPVYYAPPPVVYAPPRVYVAPGVVVGGGYYYR